MVNACGKTYAELEHMLARLLHTAEDDSVQMKVDGPPQASFVTHLAESAGWQHEAQPCDWGIEVTLTRRRH